jgi:predicted phosphodiesterase
MKSQKHLRLTLFSDFHYTKNGYIGTVGNLQTILDGALQAESDLVLHGGDFANGYTEAPELLRVYGDKSYPIPRLGVYGNHELEGANGMMHVTPLLCCADGIVWGTPDGKIAPDGSIAYYYYDIGDFRIIGLDTNYSWNPKKFVWEHNEYWSWGPPKGNERYNALAPIQQVWLGGVLEDAAQKGLHCITLSHVNPTGLFSGSPDGGAVREMIRAVNEKKPRTVVAMISGHWHTYRSKMEENIFCLNLNATRNAKWLPVHEPHYNDSHTYPYTEYDAEGNALRTYDRPIPEVGMARQTWFTADPLYATLDLDMETGAVTLRGQKSDWIYGIVPEETEGKGYRMPLIGDEDYVIE